ncbi:MAG: methylmalonyl Co-A mutase-associated GTPase MeaB [Burkholderiaceae bacterium]|nr:methylmalonyl Co-A mutase-associated GTPase MeaB [Burkholderiaceae bacterium]
MNPDAIDLEAILAGSRTALARAATLLENDRPGAQALHERLLGHCGRAHVVGITGAPGAGKSTLINALLAELVRRGRRAAVLAVDPSSPVTGGALLGDRVRMGDAAEHDAIFIRSVSSRGHLGGLSRTAGRIIDLFDAAGFDTVIVETVGTGQSEVEIARFADTKVVVCPPGLGDEVQAIKGGVLEIADLLVVNKGDLPAAARTAHDLQTSPGLRRREGWQVPVLRTVATTGDGVGALVDRIDEHARAAGRGRRLATGSGAAAGATSGGTADAAAGVASGTVPGAAVTAAPQASDEELFQRIRAWRAAGKGVALATVVRTWGSSPRAEGSHLAVEEGGGFIGSVSGGCVEGAVISEAIGVIADGKPKLLDFGVSDEQAWEVGLACGGKVQVYVERVG